MKRLRGFSLIEFMIAITLALIVTIAVLSVFLGSRSSFESTSGTGALTDNGRFALSFLQTAVRSAGFMACNTTQRQVSMLNGPGTLPYAFTQPLGGFEANGTGGTGAFNLAAPPVAPDAAAGDWAGGLDPNLVNLVVQNSDVLVVTSTLPYSQASYVTAISDGATNFTVNQQGSLQNNQIAVISDCAKSVVFQITGVAPGANAVISHGMAGAPGNNASALPLSFPLGAEVAPVDTTVFFIGQGADGDGALFAYDLYGGTLITTGGFTATPNELVPDVEAMQVLYGLDTTGTQVPSQYVTADQVPNFNLVMSVKIAVLAASAPGAVPAAAARTFNLLGNIVTVPADTRARQVFEITVSLRDMET